MARIDGEQLGELLSGYIDGELDPRERQIIERVLREDESARQLLADLRRTAQAVSSLPRHAAPSSILGDTTAILERTVLLDELPEPRPHQTHGRMTWVARLSMAAMVGLVVLTGWWFTNEQTRHGSKSGAELAQHEVLDADVKVEGGSRASDAETAEALASRVRDIAANGTPLTGRIPMEVGSGAGGIVKSATLASVDQQLRNGLDPNALRDQTFTFEPLRLQVTVRNQAEREKVATRVAVALSNQQVSDLASPSGARTPSGTRFFFQGKAGVNFKAANEDQILVHASPRQIDHLLTDLAAEGGLGDSVAMVAGPISVQGVAKSRSVVQLLGEQRQADVPGEGTMRNDETGSIEGTDLAINKSETRDDALTDGLLKIVGIDPKLLSSESGAAVKQGGPPTERAGDVGLIDSTDVAAERTLAAEAERAKIPAEGAGKPSNASAANHVHLQPSPPPPLVERRWREVTESSKLEVLEPNVTLIVQIIENPDAVRPLNPPRAKPSPPAANKAAE